MGLAGAIAIREGCLTLPGSVLEGIDFLRLRILVAFSARCRPMTTARRAIVVTAAAVAALAWVEDVSFEKATAGSVSSDRAPAMVLICVGVVLGIVCFPFVSPIGMPSC